MQLRRSYFVLLAILCCGVPLYGQLPNVVQWSASISPQLSLRPGSRLSLQLAADIQDGWHVYALTQTAGGPFPLRVVLDDNDVVQAVGKAMGSAPTRKHDSSFDLETQTYAHFFAIRVPLQIQKTSGTGKQLIPVAIRFQACSERTCLPPRTIHLSVPIEVAANR